MIVDVNKGDMYYDVFLDGVKVLDVIRANDIKGTCICYERDSSGLIIINGECISTVELKGKIVIAKQQPTIGGGFKT